MLKILQHGKEGLSEVSLDEIDFHKVKWIDCLDPTPEELHTLSEKITIPKPDMERCLDKEERPAVEDLQHFTLIIFKSPLRNKKSVTTSSFSILISEKLIVTLRRQEVVGISNVHSVDHEKLNEFFHKGTTFLAYQILERVMDDYFSILDYVEERIDHIETKVFSHPEQKLVKEIFSMKKTLIYFHKALSSDRDVMSKMHKEDSKHVNSEELKLFRYVADDVVQLIDVVATYRDILTGSLDLYLGSMSHSMNIIMKKMAAFGAVILVPTLIAAIYGMNFIHMPELYWEYGYYGALGLMFMSIVILVLYFKKKDWF